MNRSFPLAGIFFALALVARPFDSYLPLGVEREQIAFHSLIAD